LIEFFNDETPENCSQFGWNPVFLSKAAYPYFWSKGTIYLQELTPNRAPTT
jgi:hypothetical protein